MIMARLVVILKDLRILSCTYPLGLAIANAEFARKQPNCITAQVYFAGVA